MLSELFAAYRQAPQEMSPDYARASQDPLRTVADYVAGMTDRFAMREHFRLTGRRLFDL
jgi:dGTPase